MPEGGAVSLGLCLPSTPAGRHILTVNLLRGPLTSSVLAQPMSGWV